MGVLPIHPAAQPSEQDDAAEDDAVVGEGHEIFAGHETQQGFYGDEAGGKSGGKADGDEAELLEAENVFELLMGAAVEPRRGFIIEGASDVDRERIDA